MEEQNEKILSIDIGGSHIKATVLNSDGQFLEDYQRQETPKPPTPDKVMALIEELIKPMGSFDKITAGFPGYKRRRGKNSAKAWQ